MVCKVFLNVFQVSDGRVTRAIRKVPSCHQWLCTNMKACPMILRNFPKGWGIGRSENGWMTCPVFYEYITNVFYPWLENMKIKRHIVLFLDGHVSHLSLQLSEFCSSNDIHLVTLYPHATHLKQPMDVVAFAQLKKHWKTAVNDWKFENEKMQFPKQKFASLLETILPKLKGMASGFKKCGLFPFTPIIITNTRHWQANKVDNCELEFSFNERFCFLDYTEREMGKEKMENFKKKNYKDEDKSLFELWKN